MFHQPALTDREVKELPSLASGSEDKATISKLLKDLERCKQDNLAYTDSAYQDCIYQIRALYMNAHNMLVPRFGGHYYVAGAFQVVFDYKSMSMKEKEAIAGYLQREQEVFMLEENPRYKATEGTCDRAFTYIKELSLFCRIMAAMNNVARRALPGVGTIKPGMDHCASCDTRFPFKDLKRCSRCKIAFYCGSQCQLKDWSNRHKTQCKTNQKTLTPFIDRAEARAASALRG